MIAWYDTVELTKVRPASPGYMLGKDLAEFMSGFCSKRRLTTRQRKSVRPK